MWPACCTEKIIIRGYPVKMLIVFPDGKYVDLFLQCTEDGLSQPTCRADQNCVCFFILNVGLAKYGSKS